ncbi:hypothetical protein E4U30_000614 [Claviceps sp. LM220 group G6]|nr:hypothetical protein E4U30_000614 [Claviceps sp. LM220 group G6]
MNLVGSRRRAELSESTPVKNSRGVNAGLNVEWLGGRADAADDVDIAGTSFN